MSWVEHPDGPGPALGLDEALINITSAHAAKLLTLSVDCFNCPFRKIADLKEGNTQVKLNIKRMLNLRVLNAFAPDYIMEDDNSGKLCEDLKPELKEFGVYEMIVSDRGLCDFNIVRDGVSTILPLVAIIIGFFIVAIVSTLITWFYKKNINKNSVTLQNGDRPNETENRKRVGALDTFRGISIIIMIFVNDGAGGYWFLEHATWDGLNVGDLVFPWFMWIMGVCLPISMKGQLKRSPSRLYIVLNIIKRSAILFMLGLLTNTIGGGGSLEEIRIPGVLQRFSIVYLILGVIAACFTKKKYKSESIFADILPILSQWAIVLVLIVIYCWLAFFAEVPNCPSGYLGPGGMHKNFTYEYCAGGMTGYVDIKVLGVKHIYQTPTSAEVYESGPFDPEGILGILPSVLHVMYGVQAGSILLTYSQCPGRIIRWSIWGAINAILAGALAGSGAIPINKNLWSLSFVFTTTSAAFFMLTVIYLVQDHFRIWNGVPFKGPGMNPTLLYVGHSVASGMFPFHWSLGPMNTHFVRTLESIWGVSLWAIIGYYLYFKKFFLSI